MDKLLTTKQVAELCTVDQRTVLRWIDRGELPYIKLGRAVRIDPNDLVKLLERRKQTKQEAENGAMV